MAEHLSAQPVRTKSDVLMGTPTYMAPEQCRGAKLATDRSDVYSLGVILYQMLAGQPPFLGASMGDLIAMHLMDAPRPLTELVDGLSPKIWRLVRALLAKKPSDRPPMEKVHKTLLALEEETKADPSEIELSDKEVTPPQDSQHATVDVPAPRATTSGSTSATSSKRPVQSAQLRAQLALPSAMVSDTRHIHIPRRTVHLLIGALATSAVIVTTGILLGTQAPGRPRPASQRVVGSSTSDSAETTTEPSADPATSGARTDAGTSAAPSGATAKTLPGSPDRRDATTKRTDAAHGTIGKPRGASTDETETAAPVAAAANPAVPTPAAAATAMPDLAKPAPIAPPSPNPTATENAAKPEAVVASKPSDDDDDEPAQPAAKPGAAAPAFAKATPASQASASDDPFDPLKTAEAFIAQGSYRRAMDLATQFGKQDPMRAWEIFGRAACGLRSLDRANRALRELRQHQETRRIQSLTDYCRLHKIIVPESGAQ